MSQATNQAIAKSVQINRRRRGGQRVVLSSAAIGMTERLMSLVSRRRAEAETTGRRRCSGQLDRMKTVTLTALSIGCRYCRARAA